MHHEELWAGDAFKARLFRTVLTPALYRTVALARRADIAPTQAAKAFTETLLSFIGNLDVGGGLAADIQVLHRR